jgi:hypothetical protein
MMMLQRRWEWRRLVHRVGSFHHAHGPHRSGRGGRHGGGQQVSLVAAQLAPRLACRPTQLAVGQLLPQLTEVGPEKPYGKFLSFLSTTIDANDLFVQTIKPAILIQEPIENIVLFVLVVVSNLAIMLSNYFLNIFGTC